MICSDCFGDKTCSWWPSQSPQCDTLRSETDKLYGASSFVGLQPCWYHLDPTACRIRQLIAPSPSLPHARFMMPPELHTKTEKGSFNTLHRTWPATIFCDATEDSSRNSRPWKSYRPLHMISPSMKVGSRSRSTRTSRSRTRSYPEGQVCGTQACRTFGFRATARFQSREAVLQDITKAYTIYS